MAQLPGADQLTVLRSVVFGAIADWNRAHPHPLPSRTESASIGVTYTFADGCGTPAVIIRVECPLSDSPALTFHGSDIASVAERARLTLEKRIAGELQRRADAIAAPDGCPAASGGLRWNLRHPARRRTR